MASHENNHDSRSREFVGLYQRNERKLYGYILSLVPSIAAADEISQETSLRLWEQFEQFDPNTNFGAWACTVAYYQVLKYRKTNQRERLRFNSKTLDLVAERVAVRSDDLTAKQAHLIDCLSRLDEFKRQVLRLYYRSGLTAKAVAEKLGRTAAAVEKTIVRSRRDLQVCIEAAMHREERP
jgi:RNA polymerase sigma-70 factor (ECF subfamily)